MTTPTPTRDAGTAFPNPALSDPDCRALPGDAGMSLRDWIACQAGEDDIAAHTFWDLDADAPDCTREQARYRYADAMIAARSGGAA